jgi:nucleoside-diphosphate-sugar epimerase
VRTLVTGAAGFIGSNLVDKLLADGHEVVGIDSYTPYYNRAAKERNLTAANLDPKFRFLEADLRVFDLHPVLDDVDVVFHQAAQPGVRLSWSREFAQYEEQNILVTQRLLETARGTGVGRIVYASSSSVYGNASEYPTRETQLPRPHSPYGVTKLAAEHLCSLYAENYGLPTVSLRYFTVYGPRQRPDMALHRMIECALREQTFNLYGSGEQLRDFTFVGDVVEANLAAARANIAPGAVCNVAGGHPVSVNDLLVELEELTDSALDVVRLPTHAGDVDRTAGSIDLAGESIGWKPVVDLRNGLQQQIQWHTSLLGVPGLFDH